MLSFAQRVHTQRGKLIQIQISCKPAKPILLKLTVTNNHEFQEIMGIRQNPGSSWAQKKIAKQMQGEDTISTKKIRNVANYFIHVWKIGKKTTALYIFFVAR